VFAPELLGQQDADADLDSRAFSRRDTAGGPDLTASLDQNRISDAVWQRQRR